MRTEVPKHINRLAHNTAITIVNGVTGHKVDTAPDRAEHLLRYAAVEETLVRALMGNVVYERQLLASALHKFAPDLSDELIAKWRKSGDALTDFLAFLREAGDL